MTPIRRTLAGIAPLRNQWHRLRSAAFAGLSRMSPELLMRWRFRIAWGHWPDLANPQTFDEKLIWLNLFWRDPLKTECGDKFAMREYADRVGCGHLLPRLHGVYESVDEIDLNQLPDRFVLKCTHGCKFNVFCLDRRTFDISQARRSLDRWLAVDYSRALGELHYLGMKPRIICEEFLDEGGGGLPTDYKVFCFGGQPRWILCYSGRKPNDKGSRCVLDTDWNVTNILSDGGVSTMPPRIGSLSGLLQASAELSEPFPFVRVDFYSIRGRLVLGEMTFTPNACINLGYDQAVLGAAIALPAPYPPTPSIT